jgi:hypothetical protein
LLSQLLAVMGAFFAVVDKPELHQPFVSAELREHP